MIFEIITATVIGYGVKKFCDWKNAKELGILGMPESGKTLFWQKISNKDHVTKKDKIKPKGVSYSFKVNDFDGDYFDKYVEITKNCNFNIFMFDISKYIGEKDYKDETDARLLNLKDCDFVKKPYAIIGTHLDKCSPCEKAPIKKEVLSIVPKDIQELFHENFYPISMDNNDENNNALSTLQEIIKQWRKN